MLGTWFLASFAAVALSGASLQTDIEFAKVDGESLKMDASIPDGKGPFPTVILVHGGGWQSGDKAFNFKQIFEPLSKAGFAWFSVNYRLAPKHVYPAAIDDVVEAIKYVRAHAQQYKVDSKRIAISGESAGGHIVAMIGARYGRELGIAAVVPFYPATNFVALVEGQDKTERAVRGVTQFVGVSEINDEARKRLREASPITYVHPGMPPYLFVHGTEDQLCNFRQSQTMCEKMKQAGNSCEIYALKGAPHWLARWEDHPEWEGYKQKVVDWLRQTMK